MRHLLVDSDNIESVGFDPARSGDAARARRGTLEVVFKASPDVVYRYEGVAVDAFVALVSADSVGGAFHELFRKTKHPFTKSQRPVGTPLRKGGGVELDASAEAVDQLEKLSGWLRTRQVTTAAMLPKALEVIDAIVAFRK